MTHPEQRPLLGDGEQPSQTDDLELNVQRSQSELLAWRERAAAVLESHITHKIIILLIGIDGSCVLADLIYSFLHVDCPSSTTALAGAFTASVLRTLGETDNEPAWLTILSYVSLAITSLFLIEIPLALWAFGLRYYTPRASEPYAALHLFDAFVIVVTFVLEAVLRGKERELAGLLVLLRLWRLVKLVGGLAVGAGELNEQLSDQLAEATEEVKKLNQRISSLETENQELRRRLS